MSKRPALLFLLAVSAHAAGAPPAPAQSGTVPSTVAIPLSPPELWAEYIARFEALDRLSPPVLGGVLVVGSSSIRRWPTIEAAFPGVDIVQRGFGGSMVSDVIYYAPRIVLPYRPRLIVLYAGDNDLAAGKSAETVLEDFRTFVDLVHRPLPKTRIAFLSIKPSGARWPLIAQIRAANDLVRRYTATDPRLVYVDVFTPMLGPDGMPRQELFVDDSLHMNARGYALWNELLAPVVRDTIQ